MTGPAMSFSLGFFGNFFVLEKGKCQLLLELPQDECDTAHILRSSTLDASSGSQRVTGDFSTIPLSYTGIRICWGTEAILGVQNAIAQLILPRKTIPYMEVWKVLL